MKLLIASLVVLSSLAAFAATPVALVYVPTAKGINVYDVSSAGKLTAIAGSPFNNTSGLFIGTNGKFVITLGTYYVHSYQVSSSGAIGGQVSEIDTQAYSGASCSTTTGAVLDHSGQYVYVNLCSALQTYQISSKGVLTYKGSVTVNAASHSSPVVAVNEQFALGFVTGPEPCSFSSINSYTRESTGVLELGASIEKDPILAPDSGFTSYQPWAITEDPTNHYAVVLYQSNPCESSDGSGADVQIASYTGSASGLSSTNTWQNMPTIFTTDGFISDGSPVLGGIKMNPAGNILVAATASSYGNGVENQVLLYHFNGAAPVTNFTTFSVAGPPGDEGTYVGSMQWDASNHLYLLCDSWDGATTLSVYTVTTTSVKLAGTYTLASGALGQMVVRSL